MACSSAATSSSIGATMPPSVAVLVVPEGVLRQRLAQALQHAVVVHDDAAVLARINAVGAGDGLHQGVRLHRLVDVERRQALHVEAGQPHRADDRDAERMLRVLEGVLDRHPLAVRRLEAGLHHHAVRDDVEAPLLEVAHLVLRFADDDLDDRALHPLRLTAQRFDVPGQALPHVGVSGRGQLRFLDGNQRLDLGELGLPARLDALEHPRAGDLVDAHEHRLAGLPARGAVLDEVVGQLVQPVVGGDDLVVLAEQLLQQRRLVRVESASSTASAIRSFRSSRAMPSFSPRFS